MAKIAISTKASGGELEAPMDERFGRADRFLLVDSKTGKVLQVVDNPARSASHGAGPHVASLMADLKVDAVVSGAYGPRASETLSAYGIEALIALPGMSVAEALSAYQESLLERHELQEFR